MSTNSSVPRSSLRTDPSLRAKSSDTVTSHCPTATESSTFTPWMSSRFGGNTRLPPECSSSSSCSLIERAGSADAPAFDSSSTTRYLLYWYGSLLRRPELDRLAVAGAAEKHAPPAISCVDIDAQGRVEAKIQLDHVARRERLQLPQLDRSGARPHGEARTARFEAQTPIDWRRQPPLRGAYGREQPATPWLREHNFESQLSQPYHAGKRARAALPELCRWMRILRHTPFGWLLLAACCDEELQQRAQRRLENGGNQLRLPHAAACLIAEQPSLESRAQAVAHADPCVCAMRPS